jgi:hypothetical protein
MKRFCAAIGILVLVLLVAGCETLPSLGAGWVTLFDGKSLANWDRTGDANWRLEDGAVVADKGNPKAPSYLVSKDSFGDFELRVEFWTDAKGSSGVFFRCSNPKQVGAASAYEAQIADDRTDGYSTGALTNLVKVSTPHRAAGRWNTYLISARGPQISVSLNGAVTASTQHKQYARGCIGLQYLGGVVKFRKVEIRPL